MYCSHCGKQINDSSKYCMYCGHQFNNQSNRIYPSQINTKSHGTGCWITGIIMGIIGGILIAIGNSLDGNFERQLEHIFDYGSRDNTGYMVSLLGIFIAVGGLILILIGIILAFTNRSK